MSNRIRQIMKYKERSGDKRSAKDIRADTDEKREFIKERIWPYLLSKCTSIDKAKKLLYYSDWFLQETKKASIIKLSGELDKGMIEDLPPYEPISTKTDYEDEKLFIQMFHGRSLADASALIMGLKSGLEKAMEDKVKEDSLETIDTKSFIQD